ncbi:MAG: hypothetical protein GX539_11985 [Candidatus Cloacimonetes bacterium]|nr:hypothetical protein [Candidatus Cloacimonadota bacterium]
MDRLLRGLDPVVPPPTTMLGGLFHYLRTASPGAFQPMNSNFALLAPLEQNVRDRKRRRELLAERDEQEMREWMAAHGIERVAAGTASVTG